MTPPLAFALLAVILFALFWGGSLVAQGFFYNTTVERLPLRALAGALIAAGFLTSWVWLERKNPGRYGTFFEFSPYETRAFDDFEAVRWHAEPGAARGRTEFAKGPDGRPSETTVAVRRPPGNKAAPFVQADGKPFQLAGNNELTGALVVRADAAGGPVRFNAEVRQDPRSGTVYATDERRFTEAGGRRYIVGTQLGTVFVPSTGAVVVALLLNVAQFGVWLLVFWPVLRYSLGHAAGFAAAFGLATLLFVMPLLFKPARAAPAAGPPAAARAE